MNFSCYYNTTIQSYNNDNRGMRMGQFFMNELSTYDLDLYRSIPQEVDCFYDDKLFPQFIGWLTENWKTL